MEDARRIYVWRTSLYVQQLSVVFPIVLDVAKCLHSVREQFLTSARLSESPAPRNVESWFHHSRPLSFGGAMRTNTHTHIHTYGHAHEEHTDTEKHHFKAHWLSQKNNLLLN